MLLGNPESVKRASAETLCSVSVFTNTNLLLGVGEYVANSSVFPFMRYCRPSWYMNSTVDALPRL